MSVAWLLFVGISQLFVGLCLSGIGARVGLLPWSPPGLRIEKDVNLARVPLGQLVRLGLAGRVCRGQGCKSDELDEFAGY